MADDIPREHEEHFLYSGIVRISSIKIQPNVGGAVNLKNVFNLEGCQSRDTCNYVTATISQPVWNAAELPERERSKHDEILPFPPASLNLFHGKHCILAAKRYLAPKDQVWGVNIYASEARGKNLCGHLELEFQHSFNISNREVFLRIIPNPTMENR